MPSATAQSLVGLLLGGAVGAVAQRTHFCTMGAVTDAALFGSLRRLRTFALAAALATVLIQLALVSELMPAPAEIGAPGIVAALAGSVAFGFGSVLAGGCALRLLARAGSGSLKALIALVVMGLAVAVVSDGVLSWLAAPASVIGPRLPNSPGSAVIAVAVSALLLGFAAFEPACRRPSAETAMAVILAVAAAAAAWTASAPAFGYAAPAGDTLRWLVGGAGPGLGVGLVVGTGLGALAAAAAAGRLRLETFTARDDTLRHLAGGALMGFGGALAAGCSIAHGVSGVAFLQGGAAAALAGIGAGVVWALRWLETGSLLPGWRRDQQGAP